ncbi:MAG: histidine kinase [Chloroherpetonaceae bacterium]|nr:histidine kinase [Chloroherpetonaceae bacterium]MDW8437416.1 two-component regulator propeller domain-containing protein [Chloroherpetonaceae bacterium]
MTRRVLMLSLVPLSLVAQSRLQFERIGYEQGLSHLSVNEVCQDSSGFIWVATTDGLCRYDGFKCKVFKHDPADSTSLPYNETRGFLKTKDGGFAVLTSKGIARYDALSERFLPINSVAEMEKAGKLESDFHTSPFFIGDPDSAWRFVHSKRWLVQRLKNGDEKTYRNLFPRDEAIYFYAMLKCDEKLWFATSIGLFVFDPETERMERYRRDPDNPASLPENSVRHLFVDRENNVWVATYGGGVARAIRPSASFKTFSHDPKNPNSVVGGLLFGVCEDKQGNLWIGSEHDGLSEFQRREGRFVAHLHDPNDPNSPRCNRYRALFCDSEGKIWANLSVFEPRERRWRRLDVDDKEMEAKGYVELGDTVYVFAGTTLYAVHRRSLELKKTTLALSQAAPNSEPVSVRCCYLNREGQVLVGTMNGFAEFDAPTRSFKNWRLVNSKPNIVHYGHVQCVYQTKDGRHWVGTRGGGLFIYGRKLETFENLSPRNGFPDNVVYDILEDDDGALWMTTNKGLVQFDPNAKKVLRVFGARDGLPNDEFNHHCFAKLQTGEFAGGGVGGIALFDPKRLKTNRAPLSVTLTDFKLFEESQKLDTAIEFKREIALKHWQNFFAFSFSALSFSEPRSIEYAYKLEGIDGDWIETQSNVARYNSVPHGEHDFRVKARVRNGAWGEERAIRLRIAPPFWKTTWFVAMATLFSLTMAILTVKALIERRVRAEVEAVKREEELKLARQKAILAERERISADMHDDVGATLTRIAMTVEALKLRHRDLSPDVSEAISSIATAAREATASVSEIIWSMNPRYDSLDSFAAYLREKSRQLFERAPMELRIDFPDDIPEIELSGEMRHNLFLAVKEALNNALKHSGASHVRLLLALKGDALTLVVEDDGKGIEGEREFGNGLRAMRRRMENVGGACELRSELGKGARVEFKVRLKRDDENGKATQPLVSIDEAMRANAPSL